MLDDNIRSRVRGIIMRESEHAIGRPGGKLSSERDKLKKRYLGYGYSVDDDRDERALSTYVDRSVMETVEWAMPGLMRVFAGGDEIIRFDPRTPQQEQAAADATLYVNQVVFGRNIFQLIHDTLKDGLYQRVGWCLAHAPRIEKPKVDKYAGLNKMQAQALIAELEARGVQDVEVTQYVSAEGIPLFDITARTVSVSHEIKLDPVPSENVLISQDAADVEHARFIAHWEIRSATELLKEGYGRELLDSLPRYNSADEPEEKIVAENVNADSTESTDDSSATEENRKYRIYEAWLDVDINNDGLAEKVKATYCGDGDDAVTVMKVEEWPLYRAPLFAACSVPMPHQVVGLCLADFVSDVQDLRTDLTRQYLDALALGNSGEIVVDLGQNGAAGWVDMDSLLSRGPGAVHRVKGGATIQPLNVPTNAAQAVQGIELSESLIEKRTGVTSRTQSLKADTLQNTATGAAIMEEAINQRLEMIARVYAENFFKPLGRFVLHLLHKYQNQALQLRLKGKFMQFDPRSWDPDMDISVAVGLGTGNRQKMLETYKGVLQIQQAFIANLGVNSPVRLKNVIYTCHKMCEAAGLEAPERFFGTEEQAEQAERAAIEVQKNAGPSPEEQKVLIKQQETQAKLAMQQQKQQQDAEMKAYETQAKLALQKQEQEGKVALKAMEMQGEQELDAMRVMRGDTASGALNLRSPV